MGTALLATGYRRLPTRQIVGGRQALIERVPEGDLGLVELPAKVDNLAVASTREVDQAGPWIL